MVAVKLQLYILYNSTAEDKEQQTGHYGFFCLIVLDCADFYCIFLMKYCFTLGIAGVDGFHFYEPSLGSEGRPLRARHCAYCLFITHVGILHSHCYYK